MVCSWLKGLFSRWSINLIAVLSKEALMANQRASNDVPLIQIHILMPTVPSPIGMIEFAPSISRVVLKNSLSLLITRVVNGA
jgi:hypothetical protein